MKVIKVAILSLVVSLLYILPASALTAEESLDFQFTFNPSLSISLSSDEIVIDKLMPGNYASSNTIAINVATNNRNGYTLTAEVGDSTNAALANNNLVNTTSNTSFTSLANNASAALSSFNPNYWGYTTTKTLSDSTLYSGLLYNDTTVLNQTVDSAGNSVGKYYGGNLTNFTIGANAGIDQVSGTYSNVISFAIVPNVSIDVTIDSLDYLQDIAKLNTSQSESVIASMNPNQQYTLKDERDEKSYTIAKIGNTVWMTKNLDLAGGTTLNSNTSNIPAGTTYNLPASSTSGFSDNATAYVYNSDSTTCGDGSPCYSYYSYPAATIGTNPTQGDAIYDICPKGWRLPTRTEYNTLASTYTTGAALTTAPFNGVYAGYYNNSSFYSGGSFGHYWSSTPSGQSNAYFLYSDSSLTTSNPNYKRFGNSVRCVMAPPVAIYTITYNKNTDAAVSNMPSSQTGTLNAQQQPILSAETPTRSGYNFLGWCKTVPTANTNGTDSCSHYPYAPGRTYYIDTTGQTEPISITLYAVWQAKHTITISLADSGATGVTINGTNYTSSATLPSGTYTISGNYNSGYKFNSWSTSGNISVASTSSASTTLTVAGAGTLTLSARSCATTISGTMQDFDPCSSIINGTTGTLTDSRDGTSYTVGKLADGKWWLLDNLALDLTNATVKNNLTASTTNASDTTLNYLKNGGGTASDKYATAGVANWSYYNYYSAPLINTASKDTTQSYGSGSGKIGAYYNYCAASAGSYCYGDGISPGVSSGNATEDICPKGWRMPTSGSGSSGEYQTLYRAYSSNATNFKNALRTPFSGYFGTASAHGQGSYGFFWSSTYYNSDSMYHLYINSSGVSPQSIVSRDLGYSVRCVLQ